MASHSTGPCATCGRYCWYALLYGCRRGRGTLTAPPAAIRSDDAHTVTSCSRHHAGHGNRCCHEQLSPILTQSCCTAPQLPAVQMAKGLPAVSVSTGTVAAFGAGSGGSAVEGGASTATRKGFLHMLHTPSHTVTDMGDSKRMMGQVPTLACSSYQSAIMLVIKNCSTTSSD